ncbi:MAG: MarR family transcriptional regulator [Desulfobacterium sp.]|nr:MarR family transcriptional regulator [Desulfobacterium sp.]
MNPKNPLSQIPRQEFDDTLFRCFRAIYQFEQAKVHGFGLNYDAIFLLQFLRRQSPARMSAIAQEMQIPISTATRMVDRLVAKGVISRQRASGDKRIMLVSLEPSGERLVQAVEDHSFEILNHNLADVDDADIKAFFETARLMEKILKIPEAP